MSVFPMARPSSSRCGHSTSIGATARNSGPGKSPLLPIPDSAMASSVARSASRSERSVDVKGSTGTKSTVPAIVVFSPSMGKRVMVRIPDSPAVSFAQLSDLPEPSDVTTPMPVTTTIGLPDLSRDAVMFFPAGAAPCSLDGFDQGHAFAPPVTGSNDYNLCRRPGHFNLEPGGIVGRKQRSAGKRERRQRQSQRKLRLHGVAEHGAGGPHREVRMPAQEPPPFGWDGLGPGRAGDDSTLVLKPAEFRPQLFQCRGNLAGTLAVRQIGDDVAQACIGFRTACFRVCSRFDDEESAGGPQREAGVFLASPNRSELVPEIEIAEFIEHQQVLALAVLRTTDQRDVALTGGDACECDPCGVNACGLLAHEGPRRPGSPGHDADIARQQVGKLRQEQRRTQIVHQPFVEKAGSGVAFGFQIQDGAVHCEVAFAATGGDDHVHSPEDFLVALNAGRIQRQPGGIGPDALPGFHLTLIALLGDLAVKIYRCQGMDDVRRKALFIDVDAPRVERLPIRIQPFAERGREADAGDPDLGRSRMRRFRLSHEQWPAGESRRAWPWPPCVRANPDSGREYG